MLATQLKYDLLMFSRELFYLVFTIIVPPATYIFMGQLFGDQTYAGNLSYAETYTPSFILLITFGVIFFAFGFDQVMNRTTGVEKRISLSPVPQNMLLLSGILKSIIITSIGFLLIFIIGLLVYNLSFEPLRFLGAYGFFIILNAVLLTISSAIYSLFKSMNAALVFSIVIFQIVIFTGGFAMPISMMPKFVQIIANLNPLYHMNNLFIAIWNEQLIFNNSTFTSIGYIAGLVIVSLIIIRIANKRRI
ncbi:ABC transporter permease [Sporosarcina sp. Marseille-Q4063]|uniref:ABC transporter permease n=1 Tax=Sporosarcina sp. Marseille-Q4063 TaxID=2810514 RepID=UPI001BB09020|nr:ABC transporter permease [Sporosarcina sp. Marseille-Q4063]QUW20299.1 ABC transporter permease [Sporosarcina sp. Marseille-Q4063]